VLITLYILINVFSNLRKTLALFLQAVPEDLNLADIESQLARIEQVRSTHHTHVWSLDGVNHVLTAHVVVDPNLDKDQVLCLKREIRQILRPFQLSHITVEIEYGDSDCIMAH
jgi:cobalt-zinc-cadmium efflux system protein